MTDKSVDSLRNNNNYKTMAMVLTAPLTSSAKIQERLVMAQLIDHGLHYQYHLSSSGLRK